MRKEKSESRDYTTVTLANSGVKRLKKFHCHRCGVVIFEYYDAVHLMVSGEPQPEDMRTPTALICKGLIKEWNKKSGEMDYQPCDAKYIVQ